MTIATGDELPEATFLEKTADGHRAGDRRQALFAGRRVVLFGLPGAYTGTCSTLHLPSFIRVADALRAKGVDDIVCVAVNDPHVMLAWGEATGALAAGIRMLSDADCAFTTALGLDYDNPAAGLFGRSKRYALCAEDGVVTILNLEARPGSATSAPARPCSRRSARQPEDGEGRRGEGGFGFLDPRPGGEGGGAGEERGDGEEARGERTCGQGPLVDAELDEAGEELADPVSGRCTLGLSQIYTWIVILGGVLPLVLVEILLSPHSRRVRWAGERNDDLTLHPHPLPTTTNRHDLPRTVLL